MQAKKKVCKGCGRERFIWKTVGRDRYCRQCWVRIEPPKKPLSSRSPIKPLADKRAKQNQLYLQLRALHLREFPTCQIRLPGCLGEATEIHHMQGRIGKLLTDRKKFKSACRPCHQWVTDHSREAIALGHSLSRLTKNEETMEDKKVIRVDEVIVQCDTPGCGWQQPIQNMETDGREWVNKPCPNCGAILVTEEDHQNAVEYHQQITLLNAVLGPLLEKGVDEASEDEISRRSVEHRDGKTIFHNDEQA